MLSLILKPACSKLIYEQRDMSCNFVLKKKKLHVESYRFRLMFIIRVRHVDVLHKNKTTYRPEIRKHYRTMHYLFPLMSLSLTPIARVLLLMTPKSSATSLWHTCYVLSYIILHTHTRNLNSTRYWDLDICLT